MGKGTLKAGDSVRTNAKYAKIVGNTTPHVGVLLRAQSWRSGLWSVNMGGFDKPQLIHAGMLEKEMNTPMVKMAGIAWAKVDKVEHRADAGGGVPARIRQLDANTFAVYRGGRYLGCEATLALAAERAKSNVRSEINREMDWQRAHPDEQPLGMRLTPEERAKGGQDKPSRAARALVPPATVPKPAETGGQSAAEPRERTVRAPKADAGSKDTEIAALLKRGCTSEEVLRVTGWKAISMPAMAKKLGLKLRIDKGRKPFKYYGE